MKCDEISQLPHEPNQFVKFVKDDWNAFTMMQSIVYIGWIWTFLFWLMRYWVGWFNISSSFGMNKGLSKCTCTFFSCYKLRILEYWCIYIAGSCVCLYNEIKSHILIHRLLLEAGADCEKCIGEEQCLQMSYRKNFAPKTAQINVRASKPICNITTEEYISRYRFFKLALER